MKVIKMILGAVVLCTASVNAQTTDNPPMVGGDRDAHGCIGSAGYQWSEVKGECIRIFEAGVRLNPVDKDLNASLSAFVVFKKGNTDKKAEIFVSGKNAVLVKSKKNVWKNSEYTLLLAGGKYTLKDKNQKVLYKS